MFLAQKIQKPTVPVNEEEKSFVSIPRRESVYCEDCDTVFSVLQLAYAFEQATNFARRPPKIAV